MEHRPVTAEWLLGITPHIRYAAVYRGEVAAAQRPDVRNASADESDRYEELLVNPTLVALLRQRGDIDCGGFRWVVIRYGNFYQLVIGFETGHISICIELTAPVFDVVQQIIARIEDPDRRTIPAAT